LVDLARELASRARADPRFAYAASLAQQLEEELTRLGGEALPNRTRDRPMLHHTRRRARAVAQLLQAFQVEHEALASTCERLAQQSIRIADEQLADLRLGERTRRIFHEAGLTYVRDVAILEPERALEIPQLAPANMAEVRAAILFALETRGRKLAPALPPPGYPGDLFEGLIAGVNRLSSRERETVILRTGVEDRAHDVDEVARALGCTPEQVAQFETHALNTLLSQPACVEACWHLEELSTQLGLAWNDDRLPTAVAARYPNARARFTRLVAWLTHEKARLAADAAGRTFVPPGGIRHLEEMVIAVLSRYGELTGDALTRHVRSALSPADRERSPELAVAERVEVLGPAVRTAKGTFCLPDAPLPVLDDRHLRVLNGLIGMLQRVGSARISALTHEVNRRLPHPYRVTEQYVRTWLTRHPELFTQSDHDRVTLASLDVDILCGLTTSWMPAEPASSIAATRSGGAAAERLHERLATNIEAFLRAEGPQPIARIRSHLYVRFAHASADAVIARDQQRFVRLSDGLIGLRELHAANDAEAVAPAPGPPGSRRFWRRRG
jgi:hypothetical protein